MNEYPVTLRVDDGEVREYSVTLNVNYQAPTGGGSFFLLLESGDFLLLETGDKIILE